MDLTIRPLTAGQWPAVEDLFGKAGASNGCWCMYWRIGPRYRDRRQMVIHVTGERLTIEAADPVIVEAGRAALDALGDQAGPSGTIRGDLPACASLSTAWQALHDSLQAIQRRAASPAEPQGGPGKPGKPGTEAA